MTSMASNNDLNDSAVLYGTNYDEWEERMMATLRLHGLAHTVLSNETNDIISLGADNKTDSLKAANFICLSISPQILKRVPAMERTNARLLMERLETMTSYFRLMELPPELRVRIYTYVLSDCDEYALECRDNVSDRPTGAYGYHAITKVLQLTRTEVLPTFYSLARFKFTFDHPTTEDITAAKGWYLDIVEENAKYLKSVGISILVDKRSHTGTKQVRADIRFVQGPNGVIASGCKKLTLSSRVRIAEHLATIWEAGELFGVEGDARLMFLALFGNDGLWQPGTLIHS